MNRRIYPGKGNGWSESVAFSQAQHYLSVKNPIHHGFTMMIFWLWVAYSHYILLSILSMSTLNTNTHNHASSWNPERSGNLKNLFTQRSISVHAKLDSVCVDNNLKTPKPQMHIQSQYGMEEKNRKIASPIFIYSRSRRMEDDAALAQPEAAGSAGPAAGR